MCVKGWRGGASWCSALNKNDSRNWIPSPASEFGFSPLEAFLNPLIPTPCPQSPRGHTTKCHSCSKQCKSTSVVSYMCITPQLSVRHLWGKHAAYCSTSSSQWRLTSTSQDSPIPPNSIPREWFLLCLQLHLCLSKHLTYCIVISYPPATTHTETISIKTVGPQ